MSLSFWFLLWMDEQRFSQPGMARCKTRPLLYEYLQIKAISKYVTMHCEVSLSLLATGNNFGMSQFTLDVLMWLFELQ